MVYTNTDLASYVKLSPNHSGRRTETIYMIVPHCVVGQASVETIGAIFASPSRQASCNYGIGSDGRIALIVDEKNRSWCTSSNWVDQRAITIECASDTTPPYAFNQTVYNRLIDLCVDVCKRNGKKKLLWLETKAKIEAYKPASDEMLLNAHRFYANKSCPGDWMFERLGELAKKVTERLNEPSTYYRVRVGSYLTLTRAQKGQARLLKLGYSTIIVKVGSKYKLQVGSYTIKANADALKEKLTKDGIKTATVVTHHIYVVYNCDALNIRKSPNGKILQSIKVGSKVAYGSTKKTVNGVTWLRVTTEDGTVGYASASYLRSV